MLYDYVGQIVFITIAWFNFLCTLEDNLFIAEECCDSQNKDYVQYGFRNRLMSPSEYLRRLTDFSETADSSTERHLNYIEVGAA